MADRHQLQYAPMIGSITAALLVRSNHIHAGVQCRHYYLTVALSITLMPKPFMWYFILLIYLLSFSKQHKLQQTTMSNLPLFSNITNYFLKFNNTSVMPECNNHHSSVKYSRCQNVTNSHLTKTINQHKNDDCQQKPACSQHAHYKHQQSKK